MYVNRFRIDVSTGSTASTSSGAVEPTDQPGARLLSVHVPRETLATTAVMTITARATGQVILLATLTATVAFHRAPRQLVYDTDDTVAGLAGVTDYIYVGNQGIDVALATAGVSKTGTVIILTG